MLLLRRAWLRQPQRQFQPLRWVRMVRLARQPRLHLLRPLRVYRRTRQPRLHRRERRVLWVHLAGRDRSRGRKRPNRQEDVRGQGRS